MSFNFSSTAGTSGMTTIQVSADTTQELTATTRNYTLSNESGSSVLMQVSQDAYVPIEKYFIINPSAITCEASGGTGSITIQSNDDWVLVSNNWISLSRMYDTGKGSIVVDERPNTLSGNGNTIIGIYCGENTGSTRNGYISGHCLSSGATAITASTTVVQSGVSTKPYISFLSYGYNMGSESASTSVTVNSNTTWRVEKDAKWITLNTLSGSGNGNISFDVDANVDGFQRRGLITAIASGGVYAELVIEQAANEKQYIFLYPEKFQVDATGSTGNVITVSANCSYDIVTDVNWITLSAASGSGNGSVSFSTLPTDRIVSNVGNIVFSNSAVSSYATVERMSAEKYLSASTSSLNVNLSASTTVLNVYSNLSWETLVDFGETETDRPWITVSPSSGNGDGTITVTVTSAATQRSCTILIYNKEYGIVWPIKLSQIDGKRIYYKSSVNFPLDTLSRFGDANLVSNTYDSQNNIYVLLFDKDVTVVPDNAFSQNAFMYAYREIILPETVETLGYGVFMGMTGLLDVTLPDGISSIGFRTFSGCTSIETVVLPKNLTYTSTQMFYGCTSLKTVTLQSNIQTIGVTSFNGCSALNTINIYSTTAPTLSTQCFDGISNSGVVHYPAGADYSSWQNSLYFRNWTFKDDL